jgi:hypothetical protein
MVRYGDPLDISGGSSSLWKCRGVEGASLAQVPRVWLMCLCKSGTADSSMYDVMCIGLVQVYVGVGASAEAHGHGNVQMQSQVVHDMISWKGSPSLYVQ